MLDLITMLGLFTAIIIGLQSWMLSAIIRLERRVSKMEEALHQLKEEPLSWKRF